MEVKIFMRCKYCKLELRSGQFISEKTLKRRKVRQPTLVVLYPVCCSCWQKLKAKVSLNEITYTPKDVEILSKIGALVESCKASCESGRIGDLQSAIGQIEAFDLVRASVEKEFKTAADRAAFLASKVELFTQSCEEAKNVIRDSFNSGYKTCRILACRHTANRETRKRIFDRDGWACKYCGSDKFLTIDHIIPVRLGGGNGDENLQCLCLKCNCAKGALKKQRWDANGVRNHHTNGIAGLDFVDKLDAAIPSMP